MAGQQNEWTGGNLNAQCRLFVVLDIALSLLDGIFVDSSRRFVVAGSQILLFVCDSEHTDD